MKNAEDFDNSDLSFQPEMCHQIYGDNENIFGYKGLKVSCKTNTKQTLLTEIQKTLHFTFKWILLLVLVKESRKLWVKWDMTVKAQYNHKMRYNICNTSGELIHVIRKSWKLREASVWGQGWPRKDGRGHGGWRCVSSCQDSSSWEFYRQQGTVPCSCQRWKRDQIQVAGVFRIAEQHCIDCFVWMRK